MSLKRDRLLLHYTLCSNDRNSGSVHMLDLVVTLPTQPPRPTRNDCNSGSIHILDLVVTLPTQPPRPTRNDRNSGSVHSFDLLVPSVMTATVVLFIPLTS